jgi:predicted RNA-binding Zn ribbon-like protein
MFTSISANGTVADPLMFTTMSEEPLRGRGARARPSPERPTLEISEIERQAAPSDTYPTVGEPLAIQLVNTLFTDGGRPLDALTTPAALTRWLQTNADRIDTAPPRKLGTPDLQRARELRAVIRPLLAAVVDGDPAPAAMVRRLNQLAALTPFTKRLHWPAGGTPKAELSPSVSDRVDALLALVAQDAIDVLGGSGAGRLRRCEAPGCICYYVKDHPRREWCSPTCGNRVRVARHYQRTHHARS